MSHFIGFVLSNPLDSRFESARFSSRVVDLLLTAALNLWKARFKIRLKKKACQGLFSWLN